MPIPNVDEHGLLPNAIHDCTIEEIGERFGNDRWVNDKLRCCRSELYAKFCEYATEVRRLGFVQAILVDGSFVTDKAEPGDIDLALVLPASHDFGQDLRPFEYNLVSKRVVKQRRFPFDLFVVAEGSTGYDTVVKLFHDVKNRPGMFKGFLRVRP
jgi:hypothetical protein